MVKTINLLLVITSIFLFDILNAYLQVNCNELDKLALHFNTDKGSWRHNYTPIYEFYFSKLKNDSIKFLEIGFASGASARMWENYFSNATLYFIDINKAYFDENAYGLTRSKFFIADQSNKGSLLEFINFAGTDFDIIIDDGGHTMEQQIISFQVLFPYLKNGGVYVIEDLHTSYWKGFGGDGSMQDPKAGVQTAIHFFKELVHDLNYIGARTCCADKAKCPPEIANKLSYYQKFIKSIHFYDSMCFIFKN